MAIVINGSGTITGISAGGLPDGSVTAADLADTYLTNVGVTDFPSNTVVQKQHWVLSTHANTTTTNGWLEVSANNRPSITPVHPNSKFIIECFVNHWGDIDNDGHGYVIDRISLQKIVGGTYNSSLYDKNTINDRGGQSRFRHTAIVEADNSISQGTTYQYQIWVQLVTTSNGRSLNVNTVPSYVVISEVVN